MFLYPFFLQEVLFLVVVVEDELLPLEEVSGHDDV